MLHCQTLSPWQRSAWSFALSHSATYMQPEVLNIIIIYLIQTHCVIISEVLWRRYKNWVKDSLAVFQWRWYFRATHERTTEQDRTGQVRGPESWHPQVCWTYIRKHFETFGRDSRQTTASQTPKRVFSHRSLRLWFYRLRMLQGH